MSADDFQLDAGLLFDFFEDFFAVFRIAHGGGGAGAEVRHLVELQEVLEAFHHLDHHPAALFGDFSEREDVLSEAQGDAHEEEFLDAVRGGFGRAVEALDEQARAVRADVNGCEINGFHVDTPCRVLLGCGRVCRARSCSFPCRPRCVRCTCRASRTRRCAGGPPSCLRRRRGSGLPRG